MSQTVVRKCDYRVGRGRNIKPHEVVIEGDSTRFRVEGREYVVDLCDEHKAAMLECMEPFIAISQKAGTSLPRNARGRAVMRAKGGVTFTTKDVRQWLMEQEIPVSESGRIPNALIDQYKEANNLA